MREWRRIVCVLVVATMSAPASTPAAKPSVAFEVDGPLVGDGKTTSVLRLRVTGSGAQTVKRVFLRSSRGKVLSTKRVSDGLFEVAFRAPKVTKPKDVRFVFRARARRRRVRTRLTLKVVPPAAQAAEASAPSPTPSPPSADGAAPAPDSVASSSEEDETAAASEATPEPGETRVASADTALPPPPDLPADYTGIALFPTFGTGLTERLVRDVDLGLFDAIDALEGIRAVSLRDVASDLAKVGLSTDCDGDVACLSRAGRYARAHAALPVRVVSVGGVLYMSARLLDTQQGHEVRRAAIALSEDPQARRPELQQFAVRLLMPESYVGTLTINCAQEGADVYLDDDPVGTIPLSGPLESLPAGTHILHITKPGFDSFYYFVEVGFGRNTSLEINLDSLTVVDVVDRPLETASLYVASLEEGLEVRIDGKVVGQTPLTEPLEGLTPGIHTVELFRGDTLLASAPIQLKDEQRTDLVLRADDGAAPALTVLGSVDKASALPPPPVSKPTGPPPASRPWQRVAGLVVAGLGTAGILTGSYLGNQLLNQGKEADAIIDEVGRPNLSLSEFQDIDARRVDANRRGAALERWQWISYGGGAALLLAGGGLLLWSALAAPPDVVTHTGLARAEGQPVSLGVVPVSGGGLVMLRRSWP